MDCKHAPESSRVDDASHGPGHTKTLNFLFFLKKASFASGRPSKAPYLLRLMHSLGNELLLALEEILRMC